MQPWRALDAPGGASEFTSPRLNLENPAFCRHCGGMALIPSGATLVCEPRAVHITLPTPVTFPFRAASGVEIILCRVDTAHSLVELGLGLGLGLRFEWKQCHAG